MVVKFSQNTIVLANEIKIIRNLLKVKSKYVAKIIDYNIILLNKFENNLSPVTCGYYIMPRYSEYSGRCSLTTCRHLVTALECLHATGRVHNDLKPENVMMDEIGQEILIDFGLSQKFTHKEQESIFEGNVMFASVEKLSF